VIKNVASLSNADIEKNIIELAQKANTNKLSMADLSGGTFSITNGGIYGSMMSTPIINPPQSAILGMHSIINRPIAVNNEVVIRPMMYIALSYDHRLIDGKQAVTFLVTVKKLIENPSIS
jgi:2-oxoglutarate dehydrogenase E2 component (dihydrolipoamide succinyltransferase)